MSKVDQREREGSYDTIIARMFYLSIPQFERVSPHKSEEALSYPRSCTSPAAFVQAQMAVPASDYTHWLS